MQILIQALRAYVITKSYKLSNEYIRVQYVVQIKHDTVHVVIYNNNINTEI